MTNARGEPSLTVDARWLAALVAICVAARAAVFAIDVPKVFPDSESYLDMAAMITRGDLTGYVGLRPPGYPAVIALAGSTPRGTWLAQAALGVVLAGCLFVVARRRGATPRVAFAIALVPTLSLNMLFWESFLLSESVAAALLGACTLCLDLTLTSRRRRLSAAALGLVTAALALTKPQFIFVGPMLAGFLLVVLWRRDRVAIVWFVVLGASPIVAWMTVNAEKLGQFGIGTTIGYSLTNHTGAVMEDAPDTFAQERDTYLKYRATMIAKTGSHLNTIHTAKPELRRTTGLTDLQLSTRFTAISLDLIRKHPVTFLRSVVRGAALYWRAPNYWEPDAMRSGRAAAVLVAAWRVERPLLVAINAAFLVLASVIAWSWVRGALALEGTPGILLIVSAVVIGSCVVAALGEGTEHGRYGIPTQPLAALVVVLSATAYARRRHGR